MNSGTHAVSATTSFHLFTSLLVEVSGPWGRHQTFTFNLLQGVAIILPVPDWKKADESDVGQMLGQESFYLKYFYLLKIC